MTKRAIVTGANGFIGKWLLRLLCEKGFDVTAVVRNEDSDISEIAALAGVSIVYCELSNISALAKLVKRGGFDCFYHLAWEGISGDGRGNYLLQLKNVEYSVESLYIAKVLDCKRFVFAGSFMEKEAIKAAYTPEHRPAPTSIYSCAKFTAHTMCMTVAANIGIEYINVAITNAYGPGEISPRFINTTLRKIKENKALEFTSGSQNYDFVYITDAVRAIYLVAERGKPFCEYMIGSGAAKPLKSFLLEMKEALAPNSTFDFERVPFENVSLPLSAFDCSTTERDTGYRAQVSFVKGLKRTMDWLCNRAEV